MPSTAHITSFFWKGDMYMKQNLFDREEMAKAWEGFVPGNWSEEIDVRDFIQKNMKML